VFVDNDISAFSDTSRSGYQQLLTELADGVFAAVLAWEGDRHRDVTDRSHFTLTHRQATARSGYANGRRPAQDAARRAE
jgi:DNA invertase Pin-like site-specific DNA recombinase